MPNPREQALSIGTSRDAEHFPPDPVDPNAVQPKERDYRANPKNPPEPSAPVKNVKEG